MPADAATADGPGRRRESWSLKNLVEDIAGKPISELQDPARPVHPYLNVKGVSTPLPYRGMALPPSSMHRAAGASAELAEPTDPVERVYPPLSGETGRHLHGPEHEHHGPTLEGVAAGPEEPEPGRTHHAPGPSQRPERIYLHYLLLHIDRLNDHALRYLQQAVDEEMRARESGGVTSERRPPRSP